MAERPIPRRVNILLLVISIVALIAAGYTGLRGQAYARCQAGVNERLIAATNARAAAATQDRASDRAESTATADLIRDVFAAKTPAQALKAYAAYQATMVAVGRSRAAAEEQRRANPLPAPPSETCG